MAKNGEKSVGQFIEEWHVVSMTYEINQELAIAQTIGCMCGKLDAVGVLLRICKLIREGCNAVAHVGEGVAE